MRKHQKKDLAAKFYYQALELRKIRMAEINFREITGQHIMPERDLKILSESIKSLLHLNRKLRIQDFCWDDDLEMEIQEESTEELPDMAEVEYNYISSVRKVVASFEHPTDTDHNAYEDYVRRELTDTLELLKDAYEKLTGENYDLSKSSWCLEYEDGSYEITE